MALDDKKYSAIHGKSGVPAKAKMKEKFEEGMHSIAVDFPDDFPELAAVIYQIGQLEEELDALRSEISSNKDKKSFPVTTPLGHTLTFEVSSMGNALTIQNAFIIKGKLQKLKTIIPLK